MVLLHPLAIEGTDLNTSMISLLLFVVYVPRDTDSCLPNHMFKVAIGN